MNLLTAIGLKNTSALWNAYSSSMNVFVLWLSGYVYDIPV